MNVKCFCKLAFELRWFCHTYCSQGEKWTSILKHTFTKLCAQPPSFLRSGNHFHFHHFPRSQFLYSQILRWDRCIPVLFAPAAQPGSRSGQPPGWGQSVCGWWRPGDPALPEAGWGPTKERRASSGQRLPFVAYCFEKHCIDSSLLYESTCAQYHV